MLIENIDTNKNVFIIAEIGNNHEGNFLVAQKMLETAVESGANAVKFQTFIPELYYSVDQKERLKKLERFRLSFQQFEELKRLADKLGVIFLSTPFDLESARFLSNLVPAFKIASGDNDFFPLLKEVAKTAKPIILSTGCSDFHKLIKIRNYLNSVWTNFGIVKENLLAFLHCVISYPTSPDSANLGAINHLKELETVVGYSDHTQGIDAAVLSVALGARIVEKHFTLDNNYSDFRDHQLSANPKDFSLMVKKIRETEILLGNGNKKVESVEIINNPLVRRSIAAKRNLNVGNIIEYNDLIWVRPSIGLKPGEEELILGKKIIKKMQKGEIISLENIE